MNKIMIEMNNKFKSGDLLEAISPVYVFVGTPKDEWVVGDENSTKIGIGNILLMLDDLPEENAQNIFFITVLFNNRKYYTHVDWFTKQFFKKIS